MLNSEIAYFDPNTYGKDGYSLIGPLLLFYRKLVIYGPVGTLIENCFDSNINNPVSTSLTPDEFIEYIENNIIIPIGFETFFNSDKRNRLYLPELNIITDFDKDLIHSTALSKFNISVNNDYKNIISPREAIKHISNNTEIKNRLLTLIKQQDLPQRYKDLMQNDKCIPENLKNIVNNNGLIESEELLSCLIIYDYLNNKYVANKKLAGTRILPTEFKNIYGAIHHRLEIDRDAEEKRQQVEIIGEVLKICTSKNTYGRLTSEQINEFRREHRDNFIYFIDLAFKQFKDIKDFRKRKENIIGVISTKLENVKFHAGIGVDIPINLLLLALHGPMAMSKPISIFDESPSTMKNKNKMYHLLHRPLNPSKRWAYHFVKLRK